MRCARSLVALRSFCLACLAATVCQLGCAPRACSDREERVVVGWVERMLGEPGPKADAAEEALVRYGSGAILFLETGLYDADPRQRRRIVRTLVRIGDPAAVPILQHIAKHDLDPDVRTAASQGAGSLLASFPEALAESPSKGGPPP